MGKHQENQHLSSLMLLLLPTVLRIDSVILDTGIDGSALAAIQTCDQFCKFLFISWQLTCI